MLDVFIDMTNTSKGMFANMRGGRCAIGSVLWELGIPHDRLLGGIDTCDLSIKDQTLCIERLPYLKNDEIVVEFAYDMMIKNLECERFETARAFATELLSGGREIGVNFIIASPLPKYATKPQEVAHA